MREWAEEELAAEGEEKHGIIALEWNSFGDSSGALSDLIFGHHSAVTGTAIPFGTIAYLCCGSL